MAEGQKYHAGLTSWSKWKRRIIFQIHLGYFNEAARKHDKGALPETRLSRNENDLIFLNNMISSVVNNASLILHPYLICIAFLFYYAVRLNPGHYEGKIDK